MSHDEGAKDGGTGAANGHDEDGFPASLDQLARFTEALRVKTGTRAGTHGAFRGHGDGFPPPLPALTARTGAPAGTSLGAVVGQHALPEPPGVTPDGDGAAPAAAPADAARANFRRRCGPRRHVAFDGKAQAKADAEREMMKHFNEAACDYVAEHPDATVQGAFEAGAEYGMQCHRDNPSPPGSARVAASNASSDDDENKRSSRSDGTDSEVGLARAVLATGGRATFAHLDGDASPRAVLDGSTGPISNRVEVLLKAWQDLKGKRAAAGKSPGGINRFAAFAEGFRAAEKLGLAAAAKAPAAPSAPPGLPALTAADPAEPPGIPAADPAAPPGLPTLTAAADAPAAPPPPPALAAAAAPPAGMPKGKGKGIVLGGISEGLAYTFSEYLLNINDDSVCAHESWKPAIWNDRKETLVLETPRAGGTHYKIYAKLVRAEQHMVKASGRQAPYNHVYACQQVWPGPAHAGPVTHHTG